MLFSSSVFLLIFFPVVILLYYNPFVKNRTYRNVLLLAASLFFYAWGEPVFVFLMLFSIFVNWAAGLKIAHSKQKKAWLTAAVLFNVSILFIFKYLVFALSNIGKLTGKDFSMLSISLPLGISFFTFQLLSYIFDVYYGNANVQNSFYKLALYVSMFPQLVAGPIVRYEQIAYEIDHRKENLEEFSTGMTRFVYGLAKKVLLSNAMGTIADNLFYLSQNEELSVGAAWIGAVAYTLQIYFDFSGYSDMAIGIGGMFGFHFLENFRYPFASKSVSEFWRRWHISLGSWFRDYVYIPLGGNRAGAWKTYRNLFAVWFLTGVWHGANWTFVVWGLAYFVLIALERIFHLSKEGKKGIGNIYTMFFVILLFVVFRADNLTLAMRYWGQMFGSSKVIWDSTAADCFRGSWFLLLVSVIGSFPVVKLTADKLKLKETARKNIAAVFAVFLFLLCIAKCLSSSYNPFIYFNF